MKELGIALVGLVLGCLVGWFVPVLIYPWDTMDLTLTGPEEVGHLFQLLGLCVAGPVGFYLGLWLALHWMSPTVPVSPLLVKIHDPHKVEDNLD